MPDARRHRLAIFISFSGEGGVERMIINLAKGFASAGHAVDMVLARAQGEHLKGIPETIRVVRLEARHTLTALFALSRYLRQERPAALLAPKDRAMKTAVLARRLSGTRPRLVGRLGTTVSAALEGRSWLHKAAWHAGMRLFYRFVDRIVAVSEGVARDVVAMSGLPRDRITVVRNPVVTSELPNLAAQPVDHPFFAPGQPPVVLGAGRFTRQKDFPTLIRAFAKLRAARPCRLVVLGEGRSRGALEALAAALGVDKDVSLPGFTGNPYAYMAKARLFVLSSAWEGSPNVLTEAMAVGTPVVSTDCPSGPREILQGGRFGPLVPVGDVEAMAQAMLETLDDPIDPETLKAAVAEYTVEASVRRYLEVLGL
jgi:glycosyltransferase involved in cell wall biosynthesis